MCRGTQNRANTLLAEKAKVVLFEVDTDSVLHKLLKKASILEDLTLKGLRLRDKLERTGSQQLNEHCTLAIADSDLPVYRVTDARESDLMKMELQMPKRNATFIWPPR